MEMKKNQKKKQNKTTTGSYGMKSDCKDSAAFLEV